MIEKIEVPENTKCCLCDRIIPKGMMGLKKLETNLILCILCLVEIAEVARKK